MKLKIETIISSIFTTDLRMRAKRDDNLKAKLGIALKKMDFEISDLYTQYLVEGPDEQCACMLINLAGFASSGTIGDSVFFDYPKKTEALYTVYIRYLLRQKRNNAFEIFREMIEIAGFDPHIRTVTPFFVQGITSERFEFLIERYGSILDPVIGLSVIPPGAKASLVESLLLRASNVYRTKFGSSVLGVRRTFRSQQVYHELPEAISCPGRPEDFQIHKEILSSLRPFYGAAKETTFSAEGKCSCCSITLGRQDITIAERELMIGVLQNEIGQCDALKAFLMEGKYDYIVDGANVAFHTGGGDFSCDNVNAVLSRLSSVLPNRILVVFHISRRRLAARIPERKNVDYYFSDRKENDDLTWMFATLFLNAQCVTGDQMGDHFHYLFSKVVSRETWLRWVECHIIRYHFTEGRPMRSLQLSFPPVYSNRIHVGDGCVHIPFGGEAFSTIWFCLSKNVMF